MAACKTKIPENQVEWAVLIEKKKTTPFADIAAKKAS
jgi:hypothetical protein